MRGMIDVPPPTRTSKPLTPSRSRGDEGDVVDAGERAVGVGAPSKAVLTLRGISCVVGWRTK